MPKFFWEDLEKVGKTFFQNIGAKKSKIVDKITSKLEVLKRNGAKIVLVENNH
jgi:UDP-N-acetylenolpyruvoylglucosamine reductase